ncbi:hypothetical protein ACFFF5_14350 [Lederbergia wuyishanensis]|uniref:Type II secretory pathway component PulJ n=1 Tax=Lederbergia wuyishanensis TaxID=1347903 RepID=A0ABU0D9K8_9BACI|nr:hypothetical protein [Lederbergia wuyishanensis]MCJ8007453.1 hypothetical protein [Lederbergia wuyishanensis]MDQ0345108.1 type II secretory pathway component PulJ [Lederbergia wuyishanensis]
MEWVLAILFGAAVLLLILSFIKSMKSSSNFEKQMDQLSYSLMDDIHQLEQKIRNLEIDAEITAQEAGVLPGSSKERLLLRDMLDLHKRGYSFESIAMKKQLPKNEVDHLLAPYIRVKDERSKVANDA